jgi:hypothetical protein
MHILMAPERVLMGSNSAFVLVFDTAMIENEAV